MMVAVIQTRPAPKQWIVIPNYAFGWDGTCPTHEVDLRVHYRFDQDGNAYVSMVEADNGKSRVCWEEIDLPSVVIDELEKEVRQELKDNEAVES